MKYCLSTFEGESYTSFWRTLRDASQVKRQALQSNAEQGPPKSDLQFAKKKM